LDDCIKALLRSEDEEALVVSAGGGSHVPHRHALMRA